MKREITLETKIADLLNNYEGMKDILISINPKFKKLNNPILRRTLAKVASVKQAAIVGGMEPIDLLNRLRKAVGEKPIEEIEYNEEDFTPIIIEWILEEPKEIIDANELLEKDKNPLAETKKVLKKLKSGDVIQIVSDFQPEPLIEELKKSGYQVHCEKREEKSFITYVKNKG